MAKVKFKCTDCIFYPLYCSLCYERVSKVFYTSFSTLTANEFYRNLTVELGIEPSARKSDNLRAIQQEVIRLSSDKNRTPVIIIDEADHMDSRALTDLQICFNFEMDSRDKAIVLLCGHPNINHQLKLNVHNALCQRIIMNYNMEGLSKNEGRRYITEKLKEAGSTRDIFDTNAVEAIVNGSDGTPRMMNKYCSRAMMIGNIEAKDEIDADIARKAINDCTLG
jgi:type II secretory pathway predicted ATPase ExeA